MPDEQRDDTRNEDEAHPEEGKVLPQREMMSLVSADPADPMYSTLIPADGPFATPPDNTLPVEGPDGADAQSSSTSVSNTETSSAE